MNIEACMSKDVRIASPAQSIRDAARMMKEIDAGFLPVGENNRLVGTVTDRDIAVRGVAEGKGPETPVRDVMSEEVLYCFEDEDLVAVSTKMGNLQVRVGRPATRRKSYWEYCSKSVFPLCILREVGQCQGTALARWRCQQSKRRVQIKTSANKNAARHIMRQQKLNTMVWLPCPAV